MSKSQYITLSSNIPIYRAGFWTCPIAFDNIGQLDMSKTSFGHVHCVQFSLGFGHVQIYFKSFGQVLDMSKTVQNLSKTFFVIAPISVKP